MKIATVYQQATELFLIPLLAASLFLAPQPARAQDGAYGEPSATYSQEELAQMLAPIALYPDALLAQVLMASTYPIEVIEADRWFRMNPAMQGGELDAALLDRNWDPSVKALCHFPSILALMSERIAETTNLGNAFLAQEAAVMGMVQELRARAYAQGTLTASPELQVVIQQETIIIQPANPRVIYVPYYDPYYVYGPWWYPAYPPYYWGPRGTTFGVGISYWSGFDFGFTFGTWSYFDWHRRTIFIDVHQRPRFVRHDRWYATPGAWQHAPSHRRGVAYRDRSTAVKFGQSPSRAREVGRDARGSSGFRQPEVDRRSDNRNVLGRGQRENDRTRIERDRQEQGRIEPSKKGGVPVGRDRQEPQRIERDRKEPLRVESGQQKPQRIERSQQKPQRVESDQQKPQRIERGQQKPQRVESAQQVRQRADQKKGQQAQVERETQPGARDDVVNQTEDGRRQRQAGNDGRVSRNDRGDDSRNQGRSGSERQGGRDDRGRGQR
jgi:hypothetical protein